MSKKPDPINDKQRALNEEIAALEAEIKKLDRSWRAHRRRNTVPPRSRTGRPFPVLPKK